MLALSTLTIQPIRIHPLITTENIEMSNATEHQVPADASKERKQPESRKRTVTINIHGKISLIFIIYYVLEKKTNKPVHHIIFQLVTLVPTSITDQEMVVEYEGKVMKLQKEKTEATPQKCSLSDSSKSM